MRNKSWGRALPIVLAVATLCLSGCAAPDADGSNSAAEEAPIVEAEPTPEAATENQVASVLAEYETDWRETIDGAVGCRLDWVTSPGKISNMSCYLQEQTLVITSQLVVRDWDALEIPASMTEIVNDTSTILTAIGDVDLKGLCGEEAEPNGSDECNEALGSLNFYYNSLEGQLDAWSPYL